MVNRMARLGGQRSRVALLVLLLIAIALGLLAVVAPVLAQLGVGIGILGLFIWIYPKTIPYLLILVPVLFNGPLTVILIGRATGTTAIALVSAALGLVYLALVGRRQIKYLSRADLVLPLAIYTVVFAINVVWVAGGFGENQDTRRWSTEIARAIVAYWLALYVCRRDGPQSLRLWLLVFVFLQAAVSVGALVMTGVLRRFADIAQSSDWALRDYTAWAVGGENPLIALSAGSFTHPNLLGALLVLLFPQVIVFSRYATKRASRVFVTWVTLVTLLAVLLTLSRGAWLGLGVVFLTFALFGKRRIYLVTLLVGVGVFVALTLAFPTLYARLSDDTTLLGRQILSDTALAAYAKRPWFGYGLAFFASEDLERNVVVNPHNDYLTRLLGGGIVGLIVFVLPFVWMLGLSARARWRNSLPEIRFEATAALAACLALMAMMAFNPIQEIFALLPVTFAVFQVQRDARRNVSR